MIGERRLTKNVAQHDSKAVPKKSCTQGDKNYNDKPTKLTFNQFFQKNIKQTGVNFRNWLNNEMKDYYNSEANDKTVPFDTWKNNLNEDTKKRIIVWLINKNGTFENTPDETVKLSVIERCEKVKQRKGCAKRIGKMLKRDIFERDGNKCLSCGTTENLTIDHIVPVLKGGIRAKFNLQTLCKRCNLRKGERIIDYLDCLLYNE